MRHAYQKIELDEAIAERAGFPEPIPGTVYRDLNGIVWRYPIDHASNGLGDLGQWQAFIPVATSLIGGFFGANSAAKQAAAIKAQAQAQIEIEQLRLQQARENQIPWNLIIIAAAAVMLLK